MKADNHLPHNWCFFSSRFLLSLFNSISQAFFNVSSPITPLLPAQCSLKLSCHLSNFLSSLEPEPCILAVPPSSFFPQVSPATTQLQTFVYQCFPLHLPIFFHSNYFPSLFSSWLPLSFLLF